MDLNARVDVNCGQKDGQTEGLIDRWKTGRLYHTLLRQVQQKWSRYFHLSAEVTLKSCWAV